MLLLTVVLLVLIPFLIYQFVDFRQLYLCYKYPKAKCHTFWPGIGHVGFLRYFNSTADDVEDVLSTTSVNEGKLFYLMGMKMMAFHTHDSLKEILTNPASNSKPYFYSFIDPVTESMLCLKGKIWKQRRKQLSPLMHKEVLDSYIEEISRQADDLANKLQEKIGNFFEATAEITRCTTGVFGNVILGVNQNIGTFVKHTSNVTHFAVLRILRLFSWFDFVYYRTDVGKAMRYSSNMLHQTVNQMIVERKSVLKGQTPVNKEEKPRGKHRRVIDLLIDLDLPDNVITQETILYSAAGHDTSAFATSATLVMMAMHPEVQTKTFNEIMDVLGPDGCVEPSNIKQFVYLTKVIKESLRLFPPVSTTARINTEEIELRGNIIPKYTYLMINIRRAQRDPEYWPDPLKFDPERFNADIAATRPDFVYLPFLAGSRNCFGAPFAMVNITTTLAVLLRKYEWFAPYKHINDIKLHYDITTHFAEDLLLSVKKRELLK